MEAKEVEAVRAFCVYADAVGLELDSLIKNVPRLSDTRIRSMVATGRAVGELRGGAESVTIATPRGSLVLAVDRTVDFHSQIRLNGTLVGEELRESVLTVDAYAILTATGGPLDDTPAFSSAECEATADWAVHWLREGRDVVDLGPLGVVIERTEQGFRLTKGEDGYVLVAADAWDTLRAEVARLLRE